MEKLHNNNELYKSLIDFWLSEENTMFIVIGSDVGELPNQLSKYPVPGGTEYLIVEDDEVYDSAKKRCFTKANEGITFSKFSDWKAAALEINIHHYIYTNNVQVLKSFSAINNTDNKYQEISLEIVNELKYLTKKYQSEINTELFYKQTLFNTLDNIRPASELINTARGTAIVLGAAPSLDVLMPWIKGNQHRVTIIAASRIYPQLKENGINADIYVSVDPKPANYEQSKPMLGDSDSIFIHSHHVSSQLISQFDGISFYMGHIFPWETKENIKNIYPSAPTVAHSALNLAVNMGFKQVLLAGVDLCFSSKEKTHSQKENRQAHWTREIYEVDTYSGKTAFTTYDFKMGIEMLEEQVKQYHSRIINLSSDAAVIEGIEYSEAPDLPSEKDKLESFKKIGVADRQDHLVRVEKEFLSAKKEYRKLLKLCKEALDLNQPPSKIQSREKYIASQKKIDRIESKINNKFSGHIQILRSLAAKELVLLLKKNDGRKITDEENYEWLNKYYQGYLNSCKKIIDVITEAQSLLKNRLLEFSDSSKISGMVEKWDTSQYLGRSCFIVQREDFNGFPRELTDLLCQQCDYFKSSVNLNRSFERLFKRLSFVRLENIDKSIKEEIDEYIETIKSGGIENENARLFFHAIKKQSNNEQDEARKFYSKIFENVDINSNTAAHFFENYYKSVFSHFSELDINSSLENITLVKRSINNTELADGFANFILNRFDLQLKQIFQRFLRPNILKEVKSNCENKDSDLNSIILSNFNKVFPGEGEYPFFKLLLEGIYYQTSNKFDDARTIYTHILDNLLPNGAENKSDFSNPDLEDTLLQMLTLSESQETVNIYYLLNEISTSYSLDLANALHSTGEIENSAWYYSEYLKSNPGDKAVLQKLEAILKEIA